jgi:hypothetical protein
MEKHEFDVVLFKGPHGGAGIEIPLNVLEEFGTRAQIKVAGTIDGCPYRGSIAQMGGMHAMIVKKEMREAIHKDAGDTVHVIMERDTLPRIVQIPEDFQQVLDDYPDIKEYFEKLSYTHQKEYIDWIESAKKKETRDKRMLITIQNLNESLR